MHRTTQHVPGICIHSDDRSRASLDAYVQNVAQIWQQGKERPVHLTLLRLVSHASQVCEEVRKNHWGKAARKLGEVMIWWMTLVHQISNQERQRTEFEETIAYAPGTASLLVWQKMPGACITCLGRWLRSRGLQGAVQAADIEPLLAQAQVAFPIGDAARSCDCAGYKDEVENRTEDFKHMSKLAGKLLATRRAPPESFSEMNALFVKIHHNNIRIYSTEETAFHLLEEVGEVAHAYSNLFLQARHESSEQNIAAREVLVSGLVEELADVFYWSLQLHAKLRDQVKTSLEIVKLYKRQHKTRSLEVVFEEALEASEDMVAMIWALYEHGNYLACETCTECPCDAKRHSVARGLLTRETFDEELRNIMITGSRNASPVSRSPEGPERRLRPA